MVGSEELVYDHGKMTRWTANPSKMSSSRPSSRPSTPRQRSKSPAPTLADRQVVKIAGNVSGDLSIVWARSELRVCVIFVFTNFAAFSWMIGYMQVLETVAILVSQCNLIQAWDNPAVGIWSRFSIALMIQSIVGAYHPWHRFPWGLGISWWNNRVYDLVFVVYKTQSTRLVFLGVFWRLEQWFTVTLRLCHVFNRSLNRVDGFQGLQFDILLSLPDDLINFVKSIFMSVDVLYFVLAGDTRDSSCHGTSVNRC